jgi:hypothetical protein
MRRDELLARLRRARIVAALRALPESGVGGRVRRVLAALRARPDRIVALVLGAGVLAMILHWR